MKKISLAGQWRASLTQGGRKEPPECFETEMILPGTLATNRLGPESSEQNPGFLTERYPFRGKLWLERPIELSGMSGRTALLTLERTRRTRVFLDGRMIGAGESLCAPHVFALEGLTDGPHTLTISVENEGYPTSGGHMTSQDTQSNWNGVTGEISLTVGKTVFLFPRTRMEGEELEIRCRVFGDTDVPLTAEISGWTAPIKGWTEEKEEEREAVFRIPLDHSIPRWSEEDPALVTVVLRAGEEEYSFVTGLRTVGYSGRKLLVNGQQVFLRGRHEGLQYPLTGCAPWDIDAWRRILKKAREYGLNHIRCHTCCPPEAAFAAADELGMYLCPELPFWGTVPGAGEEKDGGKEMAFLRAEGFRILEAFGAHPSFLWLSLGNELWGSRERLAELIRQFRAYDRGRLYSAGANNFQFAVERQPEEDVYVGARLGKDRLLRGSFALCDAPLGRIQTEMPGSDWDYDEAILGRTEHTRAAQETLLVQRGTEAVQVRAGETEGYVPDIPVLSHEVGQYEVYPDFREIPAYQGALRAGNLELIREKMAKKGMLPLAPGYRQASGRLAADCYRMEIEAALRSKELSGFQLLDLIDYMGQGTALVGMLDGLMEDKGLIPAKTWRQFCAEETVLARFSRFVWSAGEPIPFQAVISDTVLSRQHETVHCELYLDGQALEAFSLPILSFSGRLRETAWAAFAPVSLEQPARLEARFQLEDGTENTYPLWIFPDSPAEITSDGIRVPGGFVPFVRPGEGKAGPAVAVPDARGKLPAEYCGDFWCYPMFKSISESMGKPVATGTMGLLIDSGSPLFSRFPCEGYTTPPWYPLLKHAHAEPVAADQPLAAEMIDHWARMERLGIIWQKGNRVFCTVRLWELKEDPAAGWLACSLAEAALTAAREGQE